MNKFKILEIPRECIDINNNMAFLNHYGDLYLKRTNELKNYVYNYVLRNNAKPIIRGKITANKIKWRGIKECCFGNTRYWIEQRGKIISPIIDLQNEIKNEISKL